MRVISGTAKGTKLNSIEELTTRPTLDRVKESLFNILQDTVRNKIVLDLFAGSGALGIETLSRGATKAYFCDSNDEAIKFVKQNLEKTKLMQNAVVIRKDYKTFIETTNEKFDLIFIDPPYKNDIAVDSVIRILNNKLLKENALIILETDEVKRELDELSKIDNVEIIDQRKYGRANLLFIKEIN